MSHELEVLARAIAKKAHQGQFRRDGKTPYIKHPEAVAESVQAEGSEAVATAWLHDVLEDTETTSEQLREAGIPPIVIDAVELLTREKGQSYEDYLHWVAQNEITRKVKIADILHNLGDHPTERQVEKYEKALKTLKAYKDVRRPNN